MQQKSIKVPEVLIKNTKLMHNLSSVNFVKKLYLFRTYLQPIHTMYLLMMCCRYARNT